MKQLTVDLLEDFVTSLELESSVLSVTDNTSTSIILLENSYNVRKGMVIQIDGTDYPVTDVDAYNNYIEVTGSIASATKAIIPNPFYFHGTPIATQSHISHLDEGDVLPMVYLYEIIREREFGINSSIDRDADIRLFFVDNANAEDWLTDDHYSKRLVGLNKLVDAFIQALRKSTCAFLMYDEEIERINHADWGRFSADKGHTKRLLNNYTTAVELSTTLRIKRK